MYLSVRSITCATVLIVAFGRDAIAQGSTSGSAPAATGAIHGRLASTTGNPIATATIEALIGAQPAPVARASSAADGSFHLDKLRDGRYRLRIRALGYVPRELPAVVTASGAVDLGNIALTAAPRELQAVVVNERKQDVQFAPDRNIYVVTDMPTTRGGSALDVLRNVPAVDVDIDNVVSLRGNSGVIVQINGRPSPMKPAQLGNFLAQLPAGMVEQVEVIPNPSARDDPEGVAGIINIVLKTETDVGTSGGLTVAGGTTGRAELGGNLGYQHGALTLYGSYGFLRDDRPRRDSIYRENLYATPLTCLLEKGLRTQVPRAHTFTSSAGYKLGEHDELSADLMYSTRREEETYSLLYRNLDASQSLTSLSDRYTAGTNREFNLESTAGYKHAFAQKGHKLATEFRLFRAREGGPTSIADRALALDGSPVGTPALENQAGYEHPDENSAKVDYSRPLAPHLRMEAGYKGAAQRFHTTLDTRVFDATGATSTADPLRTSDFTYDQVVNAGYTMLNGQAGKLVLQGGLRAERATTQFHLNAQNATFDNNYNSLFPSGLVLYNVDGQHQMKLSYSTRIRRPDDADQIDPTLHYQDPLNVSRGNPNLRPEYIRALELGLQRTADHLTMQFTPFYRHTIDAVRSIRTIDSVGVATRTFANVATSDAYGTDGTMALSGSPLSGFIGASAFRQQSNAANLAPGLSARTFGWSARTNASYRFSKTLDVQGLLFYRAAMTVEQGRNSSQKRFSIAGRKKLMDDQLNIALRVIDPFNTSHEVSYTNDPRFYQVSERSRSIRGLVLSVNWMFGKPDDEHRNNDLVSEGGP